MLYRPQHGSLWDTTLIHDGERFHLFHIAGNGLGHAISTDLAHWEELPGFELKGPDGSWNADGAYLTGDIVFFEGQWRLFAGAMVPDSPTLYGLFSSPDLQAWTPHPDNPVLCPLGPYYRQTASPVHAMHAAWRDPALYPQPDGSFEALLCARRAQLEAGSTGAVIGRLRSRDLVHWEALPPLADVGECSVFAEVPGWFTLGGRHYLYYLDLGWGGTRVHVPTQGQDLAGTFYRVADAFEGPYRVPEAPLLIGMRGAHMGPWAARVREHEGRQLLYHHTSAARPAFAPPKEVVEIAPGELGLKYLPLMDRLAERTLADTSVEPVQVTARTPDAGHWESADDGILGTCLEAASSAQVSRDDCADLIFEAEVTLQEGACAGIAIRASTGMPNDLFSPEADQALLATLDVERQQIALRAASWVPGQGWGFAWLQVRGFVPRLPLEQVCPAALKHGVAYHLRVLARGEFLEGYVNGLWKLSLQTEDFLATGKTELLVERGVARFTALKLQILPKLA